MKSDRLALLHQYIEDQGIQGKKNISILVDTAGKIISLAGFSFDIGLVRPLNGSNIADFHPVFEGLFPLSDERLVLPNIETQAGAFFDIHLLRASKLCWVLFEEKTAIIEQFRPELQKHNYSNFKKTGKDQDDLITADLLGQLDYLLFKEGNEGEWKLLGSQPSWTPLFFPEQFSLFTSTQLCEIFPFLDTILYEDQQIGNPQTLSGIWTEQKKGETFHFRAGYLFAQQSRIFFIKKLHPQIEANQELVQQARNQELALEDWTKAARIAQSLNKTKEQFVSIISHDLRSPFISIISALDYLFEDQSFIAHLSGDHREFLDYIYEDSKRLLVYLEKLLDWTRLDTGKLQPVIQEVDFGKLMELSFAQFNNRLSEKGIELIIEVAEGYTIMADPTLFSQVINNLIGNAIKFTQRNGKIWVQTTERSGRKFINIKDNGVGIPASKMDVLFKEYEKYYTYGTDGEKGTGLGLSITKKILDAHNYFIHCESELEKGTEFIIEL